MRTGNREDQPRTGGDESPREDRVYSWRGRSGDVSWDLASAQDESVGSTSSGSNSGGDLVSEKTWFDPVESDGCKDGICPVPWLTTPKVTNDDVNHPSHYTDGSIECIEAIEAQLTPEEYRGYLKGNIVKYVWRERHKGNTESLKKAQWYIKRLVEFDEAN